ncbi:MAG: SDR family oxidoreductase [Deltaproteobacteria bacterium]|nr:SDR family oxidoreductase [Deltaproteobacteria bacterium]
MSFSDRTVIVTGASLGVGRAVAQRFHSAGANVVLVARREAPLQEVADALGDAERVMVRPTDVADLDGLEGLIEEVVARFGALHGLVNNAGLHHRGPVASREARELASMVDVNLRGPNFLTRLTIPHLKAAGGGFVVNVASLAGKVPLDGAVTYSSTKFGLRAFTFALAQELLGTGITVSAVSPGPVDTGFIMDELDEVDDIAFSQRVCTADHVAKMVLDCARDGRLERDYPSVGGKLATLSYLLPALGRMVRPLLARKGRAQKERLRRERGG